ncbi:Rrf2 family transcriptional regulator [Acidovorax sp. Root217]|uniref:RrF2 family transcriptional regulator n=1 Tax=Acidovorax sp. Root217 TaxID=1736492 RepID=UPI0007109F91|nr:Rrf2 family transcriptional regulator [Acidovorax sp. Root217]KRC23247.1 Rrf2 family transcriptional regulator [Acidovorax sp. Root217]
MRLTLFTDYSLRVLLVLASRTESLVTIADITEAFDISQAHLMKVTHALGKTGWVDTVRGRNGGMRLAVDPRRLSLGEVVRRLEADFALVECMGEDNHCVLTGGCGLEAALRQATEVFLRELDRYTIADLVNTSPALAQLALWQPVTWKGLAQRPAAADRSHA